MENHLSSFMVTYAYGKHWDQMGLVFWKQHLQGQAPWVEAGLTATLYSSHLYGQIGIVVMVDAHRVQRSSDRCERFAGECDM